MKAEISRRMQALMMLASAILLGTSSASVAYAQKPETPRSESPRSESPRAESPRAEAPSPPSSPPASAPSAPSSPSTSSESTRSDSGKPSDSGSSRGNDSGRRSDDSGSRNSNRGRDSDRSERGSVPNDASGSSGRDRIREAKERPSGVSPPNPTAANPTPPANPNRDRDRDRDRDRNRDGDRHRDHDRHRHRHDGRYHDYSTEPTITYESRNYGNYAYGSTAYERGYQDGLYTGANDARRGQSNDPGRSHFFKSANADYDPSFGNRGTFQQAYRDGFLRGYQEGYANWQQHFNGRIFNP